MKRKNWEQKKRERERKCLHFLDYKLRIQQITFYQHRKKIHFVTLRILEEENKKNLFSLYLYCNAPDWIKSIFTSLSRFYFSLKKLKKNKIIKNFSNFFRSGLCDPEWWMILENINAIIFIYSCVRMSMKRSNENRDGDSCWSGSTERCGQQRFQNAKFETIFLTATTDFNTIFGSGNYVYSHIYFVGNKEWIIFKIIIYELMVIMIAGRRLYITACMFISV